ncbi:hypothetical protein FOMPIDRAFT_1044752 [Fomitopsis schrenkii]|uniref:Fungal-type protein kinase domain-containing protein n=1 Tax=Fomitopsis schrenkii TaxID=2126942 RepID=S8EMM9_FOMSC|nr:hypothetical protein FOMPIDRAFT_1044752 [Fomitopsis schrenkii]
MRLSPQDWQQLFVEASSQAAAHAKSIKQAYAGDIRWNVDVHSFVEAVFLEGPREEYQLSASDMPVKHVLGKPKETETSKFISPVTDALLSQLYGANGPKDTTRANVLCKASIEHDAESGRQEPVLTYVRKVGIRMGEDIGEHHMKETNDRTYREEETSKPTWEWAMMPIKVERTQVTESNDLSEISLRKEDSGTFVALDNTPRATPDDEAHTEDVRVRDTGSQLKKLEGPPRSPSAQPSQTPSSAWEMQHGNGSTISKRKHEPETHESQASIEPSPKRARTSQADAARDITETEFQFIKYLNNTMSRNIRSYAIGWLIEDDTLRLVYADRMGVVFTKPFEFLGKDATLFSLVVAAMGAASEHELGIHPNVHWPRLSGDNADEQHEVATLLLDGQGEDGSEVLEYDFDVDEKAHRSVYTEFGLNLIGSVAHHWAYETSKVLHCDISLNNIMWFRRGEEIIGVLCGWDLAVDQENSEWQAANIGQVDVATAPPGEDKGKSVSLRQSQHLPSRPSNVEQPAATPENKVKSRYRTCTGPFMAEELLFSNPPPAHKYRYDVESFFYVYVCGAATYRPDGDKKIFVIKDWDHESLKEISHAKFGFMMRGGVDQYDELFEGAHADFKPAIDGFLYDMWFAFGAVSLLSTEINRLSAKRRRLVTPEDEKMIADKRQAQDDKITYQAFMKLLGEPELLAEASPSA